MGSVQYCSVILAAATINKIDNKLVLGTLDQLLINKLIVDNQYMRSKKGTQS